MKYALALSFMFFFSFVLKAAEADHYTISETEVADVTTKVNQLANEGLQERLDYLNANGGCDESMESEEKLYEALTDVFSNHKKGMLVNAVRDGSVSRTVINLNKSIYDEWSIFNGFLLGRRGAAKSPLALFPLIKVGDTVIGGDKLEHMFGMGLRYFKSFYFNGKPLVSVLKNGIFKEKTFLGGNILATGVFSYADLSANFNGMRFWNHMLQKRDDVMGSQHNIGPYVYCKNGKWERNLSNPIDFRNYVDDSMKESVNCSKFASRGGLKKFEQALNALQNENPDRVFTCPISKTALEKIREKYSVEIQGDSKGSKIEHWIINDDGNEVVSYFNEF